MIIFQSKLLRGVSSDAPDVLAPNNLESSYNTSTQVMTLTWTSRSSSETGQRVYRSLVPTTIEDLGEPYALLGAGITEYEDEAVTEGQVYYYRVSSMSGGNAAVSAELRAKTILVPPFDIEGDVVEAQQGDPHWDKVVSLLHFDGDLTDEAGNAWQVEGGASVSEAGGVWGGRLDLLQTPASLAFAPKESFLLYDRDFTLEFFISIPEGSPSTISLMGIWGSAAESRRSYQIYALGTDLQFAYSTTGRNQVNLVFPGVIERNGSFNHIAICRQSSTIKLFSNGFLSGTAEVGASVFNVAGSSTDFVIGAIKSDLYYGASDFTIDEFRLTKGVARYTEDFTPPTKPFPNFGPPPEPTLPDPYWDKVVSLLHFDGDLTDETGRVWQLRGSAEASEDEYVFGGSSLLVPGGTRAGLYHGNSADFALAADDFTIEFYAYFLDEGFRVPLEIGTASGWLGRFFIDRFEGKLRVGGGPSVASWIHNGDIPLNSWVHIAVTIQAGQLFGFINGQLVGSASASGQLPTGSLAVGIGNVLPQANPANMYGYIDELRITKGVARYTENFTPPAEPFPNFGPVTYPETIGEWHGGGYYVGNITVADGGGDDGTYAVIMAGVEGQPSIIPWRTTNEDTPGAVSMSNGAANTMAIQDSGIAVHPAGKHCVDYRGGGHSDWYLPSKDELNLSWVNRASLSVLSMTPSYYYWTSTQHSETQAICQLYSSGGQVPSNKNNNGAVRPVRRIKLPE